jgi:glycosyltransferase involved in cell wall biosynthesis
MKKVLIISYFYPPSAFVGGDRPQSWVKQLKNNGWYPILVTRQWNDNQKDLVDKVENNELEIEKNEFYEIHKLPYFQTYRDKWAGRKGGKLIQKILTFVEIIMSNFSMRFIPYSNFYKYSEKLISNDKDISVVIASARPFQSFFIGYKLKKKFKNVIWLPDYRDEWTTRTTNVPNGLLEKFIKFIDRKSEEKWTSNSSGFITVSELWANNISNLINKKGIIIKNGYENLDYLPTDIIIKNEFIINYVGTIYDYQDFERFLEVVSCLENNVIVQFIGSNIGDSSIRRLEYFKSKYSFVRIIDKLPKDELKKFLATTDIFLLLNYEGLKGCLPVKIFEYFSWNRPIILFESDKDLMEEFILKSNCGYIVNSDSECKDLISKLAHQKIEFGVSPACNRDLEFGSTYSREYQCSELAQNLDILLLNNK